MTALSGGRSTSTILTFLCLGQCGVPLAWRVAAGWHGTGWVLGFEVDVLRGAAWALALSWAVLRSAGV